MNTTSNLGLRKPEDTDLYDVDDMNYNSDRIDSFAGQLGGLTIMKLTQAEYDAIVTPSASTVYIIVG